jgi:spore coat protein U-like protein
MWARWNVKSCSRKLGGALLCLVLLLAVHSVARAEHCRVQVMTDVSFGTYDPLDSGNLDANGILRIRCSPVAHNVLVKLGTGLGGGYQPRYMQGGSGQLAYNLYLDASRTTVWGDGTSGTDYLFLSTLSKWQMVTIYGRSPLGQVVSSGTYSDTVVVTVEW